MQIFLTSKAQKQLSKLPEKMHDVIVARIRKIADDPFGGQSKKLKDWKIWRNRVGDYRILYTVGDKKLTILSVAHRKDAYKVSS